MGSFYLLGIKKILSVAKKILLVSVVFLAIISIFINLIYKDLPRPAFDPVKKNREEIYKIINDKTLNQTNEGKLLILGYRLITCSLIGEGCTDNPEDADKYFPKSVFGFISGLITLPYAYPPASGVFWVYNSLQNAGFIPKTYAAEGIGMASLRPFMNIWKVFRDISYMVLVLVLVAIGFMIMFRMKLNPQTVITIESILPKLVISLLLLTFSFAIAGFLIDLMYVIMGIVISILVPIIGLQPEKIIGEYLTADSGKILGPLSSAGFMMKDVGLFKIFALPEHLLMILGVVWGNIVRGILVLLVGMFVIFPFLKSTINSPIPFVNIILIPISLGLALVGIPVIIIFIVACTIIFIFFRIIFLLFSSYIKILLFVIFSPLIILAGALPGSPFNFENWFKNIIGELLSFPIVVISFLIGQIVIQTFSNSTNYFRPPYLFNIHPDIFIFFVGAGIVFLTPDIVKIFKQLILPKPLPLPEIGPGIFFAGGKTAIEGGVGELSKWGSMAMYIRPLKGFLQKTGLFEFGSGGGGGH